MFTDIPNSPSAPIADASTAAILSSAPPAAALNPAPAVATVSKPAAKSKPVIMATGVAAQKIIYGAKVYQAGATIGPAPIGDLKKYGKLITNITKVQPAPQSTAAAPAK